MAAPPEKRKFQRVPINYQVKLVAEDQIIVYSSAIDLSMSGIMVAGGDLLPEGSQCGVAILLADGLAGWRVVARGTVVRSDRRGMAISFSKALDPDSEEALRVLIRSQSPLAEEPNP